MGSSQQPQDLRQIYHHIIDDVVAKMKPGFLQESVDESVLQTIRQRWAQKLTEKGVICDPEPQAQADAVAGIKRDEDLSRKRPYDGLAPNNRQEAAAAAAGVQPSGMNMPMKGGPMHMQMRPAGQAAPGMRPGQPQMPMGRGMGAGGLTGAQQQQALIQLAMASVQHLPPAQQQAALQAQLQAMQRNAQIARAQGVAGGIPGQPQVGAGMQGLNQGLPAGQQLQNLQGLRAPGLPPQVLAAQQQQQQQQQQALHQHLMQQQAIQQQQLRMQQGLPAGLPAGMPANLQLLQQQQGVVQQGVVQQRIPQGDGSSDLPCSISEVAAAAGMQPDQLRAMMPRRIAAILDRSAGASSSSMRVPAAAAGQAAGAADVALLPPAAADTQGAVASSVSGGGGAAAGRVKPRRRRHGPSIPQVDGNGDDEEEEEEEFGGDYEGGDDDAGAGDDGEEDDGEEESGSQDEQELAKFTAELDDLEEADKEETGDVGFALYEKVHRAKNRWRCNLRYGVFLINGKEYMFNKGSTDFTF